MSAETCTCAPIPGEATLRVVDRDCPEHGVASDWYAEHGNKIQWPKRVSATMKKNGLH